MTNSDDSSQNSYESINLQNSENNILISNLKDNKIKQHDETCTESLEESSINLQNSENNILISNLKDNKIKQHDETCTESLEESSINLQNSENNIFNKQVNKKFKKETLHNVISNDSAKTNLNKDKLSENYSNGIVYIENLKNEESSLTSHSKNKEDLEKAIIKKNEVFDDEKDANYLPTEKNNFNDSKKSKSIFGNFSNEEAKFNKTPNIFDIKPSTNSKKSTKSLFLESTVQNIKQQEINSKDTENEKSLGDCLFKENCSLYKYIDKWEKIGAGTVYIYKKKSLSRLIFVRNGLMNVSLDFYIKDIKPYFKGKGIGFVSNIGNVLLMFSDESIQSKFYDLIKK
ncbi:hypothetical protein NAPIS_ORF02368 [Vairimorpha apis BRL 01]|uniref:RanBD1 domain-containing protein n=1 Tax=Vairimorpha apis BRL 01 TaxID=1037528 RepID=T0L6E4_9MICR|nr:hypothetical protein NAPIS_ORF02368 [Vairimorpha apis BRL 01]